MRRRLVLLSIGTALFLAAGIVQAQTPSSKSTTAIKGTVVGADGKSVPAAAVTCQSSAGMHPRVVHTDSKGHFLITGLKQDNYDLRATAKGAYSDWERNLPLRKGQTKDVTLYLLNGNTALSGQLPPNQKN